MMSFGRCWAVFLRYFYRFSRLDQIAELCYWPLVDVSLWGLTSVWIQHNQKNVSNIILVLLTGLILWQIVWRANCELAGNLLQEVWNRNLVNLFSTPLKLSEWIAGVLLLCLFKVSLALLFGASIVYILYSSNIFLLGWAFLPFALMLILFGWAVGFFAASMVICLGQRLQTLAWMMACIFTPFSAVYYPLSVLPNWAQKIAFFLPTMHIFEGMRSILQGHTFSGRALVISFCLNIIYLTIGIILFHWAFEKSRIKGLARVD